MHGVSLREATLSGSAFDGTDLQESDLTGADLIGACFFNSFMGKANLDRAYLGQADLRFAVGLTQEQLDRACVLENTLLPAGLKTPTECKSDGRLAGVPLMPSLYVGDVLLTPCGIPLEGDAAKKNAEKPQRSNAAPRAPRSRGK